jgi:N-acetylgalactosamine-6-sulfatase
VNDQPVTPNIILILTDDLGAGDLAITGHPYAKTPNIDKLATEGIRFTNAYMAAAWCSPSRYALMRGLYPAREYYQTFDLQPDQPTVTSVLKDAGYKTAHFGKWHMGNNNFDSPAPDKFGIDEHFTTQSSGKGWTKEQRDDRYFRANSTDKYVDLCIDFIQRNKEHPLYINLWVHPTHSYIDPTPDQLDIYKGLEVKMEDFKNPLQQEFLQFVAEHGDINKAMQAYCADLSALDGAIGRLLQFIEQSGLKENTLIAFTSDNGPGPLTPQVIKKTVVKRYLERPTLLNSVGSAGDFRDRKLSVHEGGIRVPFIVRWPTGIPAGTVDQETVLSGVDWLPTIATIANTALPPFDYDGIDMAEALKGNPQKRQKTLFWYESNGNMAIRKDHWKGVPTGDGFLLFDLNRDISESENLARDHPKLAKALQNELEAWKDNLPKAGERVPRKRQ